MTNPRISMFLIAMIIVSLIITIISGLMIEGSKKYNVVDMNDSLSGFNEMNELVDTINETKEGVSGIKEKTGALDVIGGYFSAGYNTLIITKKSVDTFESMADVAIENNELTGNYGGQIKQAIMAIIFVLIFIAIILSAIFKWWL